MVILGSDLEVVTVTYADIPLARRQPRGHTCPQERLGNVVNLHVRGQETSVWYTSALLDHIPYVGPASTNFVIIY